MLANVFSRFSLAIFRDRFTRFHATFHSIKLLPNHVISLKHSHCDVTDFFRTLHLAGKTALECDRVVLLRRCCRRVTRREGLSQLLSEWLQSFRLRACVRAMTWFSRSGVRYRAKQVVVVNSADVLMRAYDVSLFSLAPVFVFASSALVTSQRGVGQHPSKQTNAFYKCGHSFLTTSPTG